MNRRALPLATIAAVLALVLGIRVSRPAASEPPSSLAPAPRVEARPSDSTGRRGGSAAPCAFPLRWRIARLDEEFGLGLPDAVTAVEDAAAMWEEAIGASLFVRDDSAGFPIAFVFDGRQAAVQERARRRAELDERAAALQAERAELEGRSQRHVRLRTDFESRLQAFNEWAARHNAVVEQWNRSGDIPQDIRGELEANDERLRLEEVRLTQERNELSQAGEALNEDIERLQRAVDQHNERIAALDRVFGSGSDLAGRYMEARTRDGRAISGAREIQIFQFDDRAHLRVVLAHELGHAMGLGHADEDEGAVMSPEHELTGQGSVSGVHPTDLGMLRERCPGL